MVDLCESLLEATQVLINSSIASLKYDKTVACKIVDVSNKDKGEYRVSDTSTTFTAYSDNTKYSLNSWVYVLIPEGDYNNKKLITGRYVSDNTQYYTYKSPYDSFIDLSGNLVPNYQSDDNWLVANYYKTGYLQKTVWSWTNESDYNGYDMLCIKASFKSLLKTFNVKTGNYGLLIIVKGFQSDDIDQILTTKKYRFDFSNMYGDPYNYSIYTQQEAGYDISSFNNIISISIDFYQEANFVNTSGERIECVNDYIGEEYLEQFANLFVKDIQINLGKSSEDFSGDEVIVYTLDSSVYNSGDKEEDRTRHLKLNWIHTDINGNIVSIDSKQDLPDDYDKTTIHWYRYAVQKDANDAGLFWKEIEDNKNNFEYDLICDPSVQVEQIKVIVETPSSSTIKTFNSSYEALSKLEQQDVKNSLIYGITLSDADLKQIVDNYNNADLISYEGTVTIANTTDVTLYGSIDLIKSMVIITEDGYGGIYNIYDSDNNIINKSMSAEIRTLKLTYDSIYTDKKEYDGDEVITWIYPLKNTMLVYPEEGIEYTDADTLIYLDENKSIIDNADDAHWVEIQRLARDMDAYTIEDADSDGEITNALYQYYRIKSYYAIQDSHNTLECYITKNNKQYYASTDFIFGTAGSNGTQYTLNASIDGYNTAFDISEVKKAQNSGDVTKYNLKINIRLFDYDNKSVSENYTISSASGFISNGTKDDLCFKQSDGNCIIYAQGTNIDMNMAHILEIFVTYNGIKLETFLPIPLTVSNTKYNYIQGADTIIYDSTGVNPKYFKNEYKMFNSNCEVNENVEWSIKIPDENAVSFYPQLKNNIIKPTSMFFSNLTNNVCVLCKYQDEIVWSQPIYIGYNRFGNSAVNSATSGYSVNEEDGIVMATMMGAGKKEKDNSFSGILAGELGNYANESQIWETTDIGIFGYNKGVNTFKFTNDGIATIGSSSTGQIKIDGESGYIRSGNYVSGSSGMDINLEDGHIDAYNFKLTSQNVIIDSSTSDEYFKVIGRTETATTTLMLVGTNEQYLQSMDYEYGKSGFKIDLGNSEINAFGGFKLSTTYDPDDKYDYFEEGTSVNNKGKNYYIRSTDGTGTISISNAPESGYYLIHEDDDGNIYYNSTCISAVDFNNMWQRVSSSESDTEGSFAKNYFTIDTANGYPIELGYYDSDGNKQPQFQVSYAGKIKAQAGEIGGWTITNNMIKSPTISNAQIILDPTLANGGIFAGKQYKVGVYKLIKGKKINATTAEYQDTIANTTVTLTKGMLASTVTITRADKDSDKNYLFTYDKYENMFIRDDIVEFDSNDSTAVKYSVKDEETGEKYDLDDNVFDTSATVNYYEISNYDSNTGIMYLYTMAGMSVTQNGSYIGLNGDICGITATFNKLKVKNVIDGTVNTANTAMHFPSHPKNIGAMLYNGVTVTTTIYTQDPDNDNIVPHQHGISGSLFQHTHDFTNGSW